MSAKITVTPGKQGRELAAAVSLAGFDGVDVSNRVVPHLRAHIAGEGSAPESVQDVALTPGAAPGLFNAVMPLPRKAAAMGLIRLDVVDGRGAVLGTTTADLTPPPPPPQPPPVVEVIPRIGVDAPLWSLSPRTDVFWFAPTASNAASGGVATASDGSKAMIQGQIRASGAIGPLGIDASLRSSATGDAPTDSSAWLGARYRLVRLGLARFELAPAIRVGIPLASGGPPARFEGAVAAGGVSGRVTWLADLGLRVRLRDDDGLGGAPPIQGFLLGGATVDAASWLRGHVLLDAHVIGADAGHGDLLGGLGAGIEAGGVLFGAASLRVSPSPTPATVSSTRSSPSACARCDRERKRRQRSAGSSPFRGHADGAPRSRRTQPRLDPAALPRSPAARGARGRAPGRRPGGRVGSQRDDGDRARPHAAGAAAAQPHAAVRVPEHQQGRDRQGHRREVRARAAARRRRDGDGLEAQHLSLGISVAVKTMHPYVAMQEEYARRFRREAHAASLLNHPNAVRVLDFGEEDGLLYLVMEYLDGRSLGSWLDSLPGPPRIAEVGRILGMLLDAFDVAHAYGIVHRDLKPDNVFLAEIGDQRIVKVLDFGLAHVDDARDTGPTLTQRDAVAGRPTT